MTSLPASSDFVCEFLNQNTKMLRAALAASLLLASIVRGAQAQSVIFDSYQENDGLTNLSASCLTQAVDGTLWICTDNGLFRFDGFRVHRELLPAEAGEAIDNALADRQGRLWVETGACLYLRREVEGTPRWSAVLRADGKEVFVDPGQRLALDDRDALFAMDWRSRLWSVTVPASPSQAPVAQPVAVPAFAPFEETREARGGPVLAVGNALWFGCGSGLCLSQGGRLSTWGPTQGLPLAAWFALLLARDGSVWARSSRFLARLTPGSERFTALDAPLALRFAGSIALAEDPMGAIVTATDNGVAHWDGRQWRQWTQRDGMPETVVRALIFDAEGFLWLGTNGRGLHRWIGYGAVVHWTTANGLPHPAVTAFARAGGGRLWAATAKGIAWLDESAHRFRALRTPPATDGLVTSLGVDALGALWWVDAGRLLMLRPTETKPRVILNDAHLGQVIQGVNGLFLSTPRGAQRLTPWPPYLRSEPPLATMQDALPLVGVLADGTHEWFQTGRYLCRMVGNACVEMHDERGTPIESPNDAAALSGPSELWIGDDRGISVYSVDDG
ncbi:two-component regulator propeller domain-containing protein, partial [Paraburkholderia sp.]|uniref:ligand-binding sensor domain-containing protein n=1 Tax=Paraburkholderia sp. TaxID=1926495 RepID=UPI00263015EE